MTIYHDFEMGEVVVFKPEYVMPSEDPWEPYVIVNSHPESELLDVKPINWDEKKYPLVPIGTYSYRYFMRVSAEGGL